MIADNRPNNFPPQPSGIVVDAVEVETVKFNPAAAAQQLNPTVATQPVHVVYVQQGSKCRHCGHVGLLREENKGLTSEAYCWCIILCILVPPLCFLPLFMDKCSEREMVCENCRKP